MQLLFFVSCEIDIDECESNPCHHGGSCVDLKDHPGEFECVCADAYEGETCEQLKLVTCDDKPCKNDGHCFNYPGIFFFKTSTNNNN